MSIYCFHHSNNTMSCTTCFGPNGANPSAKTHTYANCKLCCICFGPNGTNPSAPLHMTKNCRKRFNPSSAQLPVTSNNTPSQCIFCFDHIMGTISCKGLFPEARYHTSEECIHRGKSTVVKYCPECKKHTEQHIECQDRYQLLLFCHDCL
jgi:ribosomal protein L33